MCIRDSPVGTVIYNIELYPGKGGQLVRSAGAAAQLISKENGVCLVRLPSGEVRQIRLDCKATIGQVGNIEQSSSAKPVRPATKVSVPLSAVLL